MADITDPADVWWTIDRAAEHLKITRASVERYIRDGLKVTFGRVHRDELLAEYRKRQIRQRATRAKSNSP